MWNGVQNPKRELLLGVHKLRLIFNTCNSIRSTTWIESGCFHAHMVYLYFAHTRRSMVRRLWLRKLIEEPNQKSHRNYTSDDSVLLYEKSQAILPSLSISLSLSFYLSVCISATLLLWCCSYSFKSLWLLVLLLFSLVAFTRSENIHHFDRGCFERNQRRAEKKRLHTFNTRAYQLIATSPSIELNWQQIASTYIQKGPYTCNCLLVARDNVWLLLIVVQCVCCFVSLAVRCTVFHSFSSSFLSLRTANHFNV